MTEITLGTKLVHPNETRNMFVDFLPELEDTGDSLTGTPVVVELVSSDLMITNKAVGSTTFTDADEFTWTSGKYVTFTVAGQQDDTDYRIEVRPSTDASNAETLSRIVVLKCRDR